MKSKRIAAALMTLLLLLGALCPAALAAAAPCVSENIHAQSYVWNWSQPVRSYLYEESGRLHRVEFQGDYVAVEDYTKDGGILARRDISPELELFGGFFAGENYNFLAFGQDNQEEDPGKEVIRVVKYSKDWKRLGKVSLYGGNTSIPFQAGSLRWAEDGDRLYLITAHRMFASSDGLNHQANLMMAIDQADMTLTESLDWVSNVSTGYVSHSFNQFILVDGGDIVTLNHGDAYPRSAVVCRIPGGERPFSPANAEYVDLKTFYGDIGANYTGAALGGFAMSGQRYLAAGSFVPQDERMGYYKTWNVSVLSVDRAELYDTEETALTAYPEGGAYSASVPQLVKFSDDRFLVIWERYKQGDYSYEPDGTLAYVFVDGRGRALGAVRTASGALSDCQPALVDGAAEWYVTDDSAPVFYRLDSAGNLTSFRAGQPKAGTFPSAWAESEVNAAIAAGIVPQDLQGQYTSNITRQEFCALAVQMLTVRLELDEGSLAHIEGARDGVPKFTDCGDSHVVTAWRLGIVDGVGNGKFAPDRSITRQEAAAMLTRAAKVLDLTAGGTAAAFADSGDVADWAREPVDFVSRLGVMGGVGNGKFGPTGTYTREQAMLTMLRLFEAK